MRTDPELWEEVKAEVTRGSKGGMPGQWSARKAQLAVALYKARGGDYYGPKSPYNALAKWTREDWRTKSGRPSLETGERYLPAAAIAALTPAEYAATTKAKRAGMKKGQQFVPQPEVVAKKVRRYRRNPRDLQTETPEFKAWFGNSKMLDEHGEPERLYHITASEFSVFKPGGNDPRLSGRVIYLTPYPHNIPAGHNVMDYVKGEGLVYRQGASVVPVYASIQRPLYIFDADDAQYAERFKFDSFAFPRTVSDKSLAALKEAGYDGIVYAGWRDAEGFDLRTGRNVEIIAFEPTQIKSAIGNRGTFDPEEADIRHNPRRRTRPVSRRRNPSYDDMRFARGVLQTPEGPIKLKKIGKGAFSTAYVEVREDTRAEGRAGPKPRVFVFSGAEVVDKELLAMALDAAPNNPHLPKVERFGNVGDTNVYVMPLYNSPFRKADSPQGWKDFSAIKKCREQAWRDISQRGTTYREEYAPPIGGIFAGGTRRVGRPPDMTHRGYDVNFATVECAKASGVRPAVVEALEALMDTASNYGASQVFEFAPRNLATDDEGNLVFLDPLFDMERLERQRAEARRRAGARWNPRHAATKRPPNFRLVRNPDPDCEEIDLRPLERISAEDVPTVVRGYRPADETEHARRIRKARGILARNAYATGKALGSGTMGTVFELREYPDYVVKLTYDPTDVAVMVAMKRPRVKNPPPLPAGVPDVVTAAALPDGLFAVVLERLQPLRADQRKRVTRVARDTGYGSDLKAVNRLWARWKEEPEEPEHAFLNAARILHGKGFTPYDIDAPNMMRREDDSVVVSDFGYSIPARRIRGPEIARLENPAGGVYDRYDFVVTPSESSQQLWEPTGEGAGVRPVRYTYTRLQVLAFERGTQNRLGAVSGSSEERAGARVRLRDTSCERDFAALAARHPGLRGEVVVTGSFLEEAVRGKGVGLAMYRLFAQEAGKRGLAVVPEECWSGTALTSADAKRVWAKLAREPGMDAEGRVVYAPQRGA